MNWLNAELLSSNATRTILFQKSSVAKYDKWHKSIVSLRSKYDIRSRYPVRLCLITQIMNYIKVELHSALQLLKYDDIKLRVLCEKCRSGNSILMICHFHPCHMHRNICITFSLSNINRKWSTNWINYQHDYRITDLGHNVLFKFLTQNQRASFILRNVIRKSITQCACTIIRLRSELNNKFKDRSVTHDYVLYYGHFETHAIRHS